MLLRTLDRSLDTWVYPEHNRLAFGSDYRLRSLTRAEELVRGSRAPVVVFKPICDSHRADLMLDHFSDREPRGVWIYRSPGDVVNSLVKKWGDQFARVVRAILDGRTDEVGWRGERIGESRLRAMARLTPDRISAEEGAAVFWWLRNAFYFDLDLASDRRVRPVSYERLVGDPEGYLPSVFQFAGLDFEPRFAAGIHAGAVGREAPPRLPTSLRDACEAMEARLDAAHGEDHR